MMTTIENHERISQCLKCPAFKTVISDYILTFYDDWKEYKAYDGDFKYVEDFDDFKGAIKNLVESLRMEIDINKIKSATDRTAELHIAAEALGKLSQKNTKVSISLFPYTYDCAAALNQVLPLIINFVGRSDCPVQSINSESAFVLSMMKHLVRGDRSEQCDDISEQCDDVSHQKKFRYPKTSYRGETYDFGRVIQNYCSEAYKIEYQYCSPVYNEFQGYNLRACQGERFLADLSQQLASVPSTLDIKELNAQSRKIFYEFLVAVPKSFGYNLSKVMLIQGMTDNTVAELIGKNANNIQALRKCKEHKHSSAEIKKLARALLVSEDVLYCGSGQIYGNWQDLLNLDSDASVQESLNAKNNLGARKKLRDIIKESIKKDDIDFKEMLRHEFFFEKSFCAYLIDDKDSYDYDAMYQNALHPEEIDILISVLKKCQSNDTE